MTVPSELDRYASDVATRLSTALGDDLVGVWLLGSGALGGFDVMHSDIDLLVVSQQVASVETRLTVAALIGPDGLVCPAQGVELVWYAIDDLRPLGEPSSFQLNLNGGRERETKVQLEPGSEADHWFVIDLAVGRETAVPLVGPPLAHVASPVADERLRRALGMSLAWHDENDATSPNRVLNAARMMRYLQTGTWTNKLDAAKWLAVHQPALADAMNAAVEARLEGRPMDPESAEPVIRAASQLL